MLTQEDIDKELRRINSSVPTALREHVTSETELTPTMALVVDKALESPDISDEKKAQLKQLKEAGYFSKKKITQNDKIAKMVDDFIGREIKKSVKAGRLPNKKQLKVIMDKINENKK